jgi:hypothetical protein
MGRVRLSTKAATRKASPETHAEFRHLRRNGQPRRRRVLSAQPREQTVEYVLGKEKEYFSLNKGQKTGLGGCGVPQHAGRRQRSRHRSHPDRASAPDVGSDPPRRPSPLDGAHRLHPRPRQVPLPLRRAAVGRGRRHLPCRLRLVQGHRLSPSTSRTIPTATCRVSDQIRHLRAELRPRERPHVASATTATSPR